MTYRDVLAAAALLVWSAVPAAANDPRVLWAATRDGAGLDELAADVAADSHGIAVAAGHVQRADGSTGFAVRAHAMATGDLLWEDLPALGDSAEALAVAIGRGTAVAVGLRGIPGRSDLVVRAYAAGTGALLWSHVDDAGDRDVAFDVAIRGGLAVIAGELDGTFTVRAYDLRTGALRWQDRGGPGSAGAVAIRGRSVVAAGSEVRAYDLFSGALRWAHADTAEVLRAVALRPPFAIVAGDRRSGADPDSLDFLVRALDLVTGRIVWTDVYDHRGELDRANGVAVAGRVVVSVGSVRSYYDAPIVRAYDLRDGGLLWSDLPAAPDSDTAARAVAIRSNTAIVAASLFSDSAVLAYDARRGVPLWRHDDPLISGFARAVATAPGRVLVAGGGKFLADPVSDQDFAVRAYRLRGRRPSMAPRFADQGDGTVLDRHTGLRWEKKAPAGSGPQAVDATFTWCADVSPMDFVCDDPTQPRDGTAYTAFLPYLDGIALGGARDWRLPTDVELLSLELCEYGTGTGGGSCLDPVFGRVASDWYWSSSVVSPGAVGIAEFDYGYRHDSGPARSFHVRAVRGVPREPTG